MSSCWPTPECEPYSPRRQVLDTRALIIHYVHSPGHNRKAIPKRDSVCVSDEVVAGGLRYKLAVRVEHSMPNSDTPHWMRGVARVVYGDQEQNCTEFEWNDSRIRIQSPHVGGEISDPDDIPRENLQVALHQLSVPIQRALSVGTQ